MKPRSRRKHKGRSESGTFTLIPHHVQDSDNWRQTSGTAIKLLCDIARQYNGRNNGDLCASLSVLRSKGWTSPETVTWAARELRHFGFITLTRQGGLYIGASLYALSWHPIHECGGKLDCAATAVASGEWKHPKPPFIRPAKNRKPYTPSVADQYANRIDSPETRP